MSWWKATDGWSNKSGIKHDSVDSARLGLGDCLLLSGRGEEETLIEKEIAREGEPREGGEGILKREIWRGCDQGRMGVTGGFVVPLYECVK